MEPHQSGNQNCHRKSKQRQVNPITAAALTWIATTLSPTNSDNNDQDSRFEQLLSSAPKRFTIYEPLALLPTGSFASEPWASVLQTCDEAARNSLWSSILEQISKAGQGKVTHLAVNEGIPLHKDGEEAENVRRSPSGLKLLFGDFGPAGVVGEEGDEEKEPTERDFEEAFWVGTKQNGIVQTWAPRWTMFSRGNVKEKARVLGFKRPYSVKRGGGGGGGGGGGRGRGRGGDRWAVDMYAGIGYFVFSYAKLGMRVLCWEINPWSVEGLRRGALANKWTVRVVQGEDLKLSMEALLASGEQIVIFLESNERAGERIQEAQARGLVRDIEHVNGGFLPTSEPVWRSAWEMTGLTEEAAWLHLHENVGVEDITSRRMSIQGMFEAWAAEDGSSGRRRRVPRVEHVEQVKTFAPGVWHCVFDVCITSSMSISSSSSISNNST